MSDKVEIEIDGKTMTVKPGIMLIEAADQADIRIPRFCYHKKLSVAANCRMCLVDVENAAKPLPACATPVVDGMKVKTKSALAVAAQKSVMEFLLINHPLDCPICDQGGQCELQDVAMGFGEGVSHYAEAKRAVKDENIGPLIATEMTRCIHCTRCVRFGEEVVGLREMGATGRGENMQIGTYVEQSLQSELSGNIIDLCPVGALVSKPFLFKARAWELQQVAAIAMHDCVGSNISVHHLRGKVQRVVPRENEQINETWISDRDRFSYVGLDAKDRVTEPMLKQDGEWKTVSWQQALQFVVDKLNLVVQQHLPAQIGCLASPSATIEELYLLQKLLRGLGSHNIDHRLHQVDFSRQNSIVAYPGLNLSMHELSQQRVVLLVGSNIQKEQPIAGLQVRKASLNDGCIMSINPVDYEFNFIQQQRCIVAPSQIVQVLAEVAKCLLLQQQRTDFAEAQSLLDSVQPRDSAQAIAKQLSQQTGDKVIILGALAINNSHAGLICYLAELIAELSEANCGLLTEGANAAGAWLAGAIPHRTSAGISVTKSGMDCQRMLQNKLKAYLLFGIEPELDCADPAAALAAMHAADLVVSFSAFASITMRDYATVILPIAPFTETAGTIVNAAGTWQSFQPAAKLKNETKPGWKVLRVLGNLLQLNDFEYKNIAEIIAEIKLQVDGMLKKKPVLTAWNGQLPMSAQNKLEWVLEWPIYRIDALVRRSQPLQEAASAGKLVVRINKKLASELQLQNVNTVTVKQAQQQLILPLCIDDSVADGCVVVPGGYTQTSVLANVNKTLVLEAESNS